MAKVHQCNVQDDQDRKQGQQACMVLPNVTVLISFFLTKGNKKILIHKEKSRLLFSATAHRDFEIFNMINQGLARIQSNIAKINPELTVNPEALLIVKVENLHAVSHFKHPTCVRQGISKKNDAVVRFLLHTLNIVLSCTLDTNSPLRFSKDDAKKPACHEFS